MARKGKRGPREHELVLNERHVGQQRLIDGAERFNTINCGRRWGKTEFLVDLALDGRTEDDKAALVNGGRVGWWVGRESHFSQVWDEVSTMLKPISKKQDANLHSIRLLNGAQLDFWTLYKDPNVGRGRKYHRAIVDEAAFAKLLEKAWQTTILPTLTDFKGDGWFASTPVPSYFRHLCRLGDPKSEFYRAGWKHFHEPTWNNPYIDPVEVEKLRLEMTDSTFRQEYGAEFVESEGGWFKRDWIRWYHREAPGDRMQRILLCDPASGRTKQDGEDFTAFWVIGLHDDGNYYVLDFVRERYDLVERTKMLFALQRRFKPHLIGYEQYGMQSDLQHIAAEQERLHRRFDIIELGGQVKKEKRIERLVGPFKTGRIYFPSDQVRGTMIEMAYRTIKMWIEIEMLAYPASENDDGLDCLARIFDIGAEFPDQIKRDEAPEFIPRPSIGSVIRGRY